MYAKKNPSADVHQMRPLLLSFSMVLSLSMIIMAFEWETKRNHGHLASPTEYKLADEILEVPPTDIPPPPPPKHVQPKNIQVVLDEEILEDITIHLDNETLTEIPVSQETIAPVVIEEEDPGDEIFLIVETPPSFSGGDVGLIQFVVKNLKYPSQARRMAIEGRVFVQCVIEKDGSVTNVKCIKGIGGGCDEEAVRVISSLPRWNPGKQRGHPVRVGMVFPIVFKI